MKDEMKLMNFDERQRYCWLAANRVTLMLVGIVWLGLIAWNIYQGRFPIFLVAMVPVFALVRFIAFRIYLKRLG